MKPRYVYVTCMGTLWRVGRRNWKRFLRDFLAGEQPDLDDYGTMLAIHMENVTDLCAEWAQDLLDDAE
jgi:hypothetical protein